MPVAEDVKMHIQIAADLNPTASNVRCRGASTGRTAKTPKDFFYFVSLSSFIKILNRRRLLILFLYLAILLSIDSYTILAQNLPDNRMITFLALGDSYTIGESVAEDQRWPVQLVTALKKRNLPLKPPTIIATTGWRTDQLRTAIEARGLARNYDLVSLLIGVNNQYQGKSISEYEKEFSELLQIAIDHAGGDKSRVFVLSIPDYGYTPFGMENQKTISKDIDAFNRVNKKVTEKNGVTYINVTDISRRGLEHSELIASDGLHPSGKMYSLWVDQILNRISTNLKF